MNKTIIISAPSGAGKNSVVNGLLKSVPNLVYSISATTRPKRPDEVNGEDYYFISNEDFKFNIDNNNFVEYQQVYEGVYYGTLKSELDSKLKVSSVIFVLDVKGALNLKNKLPNSILIFINPPSIKDLEKRLILRGSEAEDKIQERLTKAQYELSFKDGFDFIVTNDNLELTIDICKFLIS